ncbi:MAG: hypothetical protein V8T45_08855 [Oscillospiraceae bacterium]
MSENTDGRFFILDCPGGSDIVSCLRNIYRESIEAQQPGYELICQAYMEILLSRLMRSTSFSTVSESGSNQASRQCSAVRHYVRRPLRGASESGHACRPGPC